MNPPELTPNGFAPDDRPRGVGLWYATTFLAIVTAGLVMGAVVLNQVGVAQRQAPSADRPVVLVVGDSKALLAAWKASGLHGAWLVDVTSRTEFTFPLGTMTPTVVHAWPIRLPDYKATIEAEVSRENLVRVAALTGVARTVTYVFTPGALAKAIQEGQSRGLTGVAADRRSVAANDDGYLRTLVDEMPRTLPSPAVLNIDASYFIDGTPEGLMKQIRASHAGLHLITLDLASDDPSVPDSARAALQRTAEMLRGLEAGQ